MNSTTLAQIEPAHTKTLTDDIAEKLVRYIGDNDLNPGDSLPSERQLADALGVSRRPLREAISRLRGMGVITVRQGKNAKLRRFSAANLFRYLSLLAGSPDHNPEQATLEVRLALEPYIARLAAERHDAQGLARLEECLAGMRESIDDMREFVRYDMKFHELLARATGNPLLEMLMSTIQEVVPPSAWAPTVEPKKWRQSVRKHQKILETISTREGEAAAQALERHVSEVMAEALDPRRRKVTAEISRTARKNSQAAALRKEVVARQSPARVLW